MCMRSARVPDSSPSSRSWPTTAARSALPATRSGTNKHAPGLEAPGACGSIKRTARLLRRQDLEHTGPAHGTDTLQRGAAVGHLHLLGVRDLPLRLTLHTVTFIRGHRCLSLCHCRSLLQFKGTGRKVNGKLQAPDNIIGSR